MRLGGAAAPLMSDFSRLLDEFFSFWWWAHPVHATFVGVHAYDGELDRMDEDARAARARQCHEYLDAFDQHAPADAGESIDRELVLGQLRWAIRELDEVRPFARDPASYLDGVLHALYLMSVREYAPAQERARRVTERLGALPRLLGEARENLTEPGRRPAANLTESGRRSRTAEADSGSRGGGAAPAPIFVQTAVRVARAGLALVEGMLPLALGRALEDDPDEFSRWENARRGAESALVEYARWLEEELAPRATGHFALGRTLFEEKVRDIHGLRYTSDDLRAYGLALKEETEAALAALATEIDSGRSWRDVAERLKDEHPHGDGLLDVYAAEMARARTFVEERGLATIPADESLRVMPTPEYMRPIIPYAAYQPPAPHETDQTGLFFVTPPSGGAEAALRDHSVFGIPVTALHEAYPGHHLQLTRANRAASEPRRVFWTSVFAEGWALYCEEMMWEQGFYTDPRERLLQLKDLLWRACRVVVDVGLHVDGWSPERAVDYMVGEAGLERSNAEVEVRRYCAEPTQPMSYAVGKREILRLRERYRELKGDGFELREFHDRLLSWGTLPPPLIARGMGLEV